VTRRSGQVQHINPSQLHRNPAFTHVVSVTSPARTIYISGQNAVDTTGAIVGKGDMETQATQVLRNLKAALEAAGARLEHVVKWNVYVVQGQSPEPGYEVFRREWGNRPNPPALTLLFVSSLAHPDFLLEMDVIAVVPEIAG
jgi:enamine deaminase RidA (YjgF/YER057c/UK114 family)